MSEIEKRHYWTDQEVATMMLLIDPELTSIEISQKLPDGQFVVLTEQGASFEGKLIGIREHSIELLQDDGKIIQVLKRSVAAVRRP